MQLRGYQRQAIDSLREAYAELPPDRRRVVLVSPVGSGKTTIGAELARLKVARGRKVLWLAHRVELIDQAAGRLEQFGLSVGVIAASSQRAINPHRPVQVASIQTLVARGAYPEADMVIADEAHHGAADTWTTVFGRYPQAQFVGLTATPERPDGKPLSEFERLITVTQPSQLIADGDMVPCDVIAPSGPLKSGEIAQRPVDAYLEHARGQSCLVFSPTVEAAERHAQEFRDAGIEALVVDGSTAKGERREAVKRFTAGTLRVIVNVGVFTEGTDLPICSAIIIARGCGTEGLYIQITGRALRPYPGKERALLIDLRGVSHIHGHPTEDREYSLVGQAIRHAGTVNPYTACATCGAPKEPGSVCAECGVEPRVSQLTVTGDKLHKFAWMQTRPPEKRAVSLAKWLKEGREKGWKPGAAGHKYRVVFGHWPPADIQAMAKKLVEGMKQ